MSALKYIKWSEDLRHAWGLGSEGTGLVLSSFLANPPSLSLAVPSFFRVLLLLLLCLYVHKLLNHFSPKIARYLTLLPFG